MVNVLMVSPLLELAGFYDLPLRMRSEVPVLRETQHRGDTLRGRIDFLVIHQRFGQAILESKDTTYDVSVALPQTLAYMAGAKAIATTELPVYGLATNGSQFNFLKVQRQGEHRVYALSEEFSLRSRPDPLGKVLLILRELATQIRTSDRPA